MDQEIQRGVEQPHSKEYLQERYMLNEIQKERCLTMKNVFDLKNFGRFQKNF